MFVSRSRVTLPPCGISTRWISVVKMTTKRKNLPDPQQERLELQGGMLMKKTRKVRSKPTSLCILIDPCYSFLPVEDEDFQASSSDEGSPSESDSEVSDGAVSDDMVKGGKKKGNGAAAGAPAKAKASNGKSANAGKSAGKPPKSKDTVDTDEDDDVMDVDGDEDQPPKSKKQKTG